MIFLALKPTLEPPGEATNATSSPSLSSRTMAAAASALGRMKLGKLRRSVRSCSVLLYLQFKKNPLFCLFVLNLPMVISRLTLALGWAHLETWRSFQGRLSHSRRCRCTAFSHRGIQIFRTPPLPPGWRRTLCHPRPDETVDS